MPNEGESTAVLFCRSPASHRYVVQKRLVETICQEDSVAGVRRPDRGLEVVVQGDCTQGRTVNVHISLSAKPLAAKSSDDLGLRNNCRTNVHHYQLGKLLA